MAKSVTVNCENCQGPFLENFEEFKKHLLEKHGIDVKTMKCQRVPLAFMDGAGWSAQNVRYIYPGDPPVVLTSTVRIERDKKDPMYRKE